MNEFVILYGMEQTARCGQENVISDVRDVLDPPIPTVSGECQMPITIIMVIVSVRKIGVETNAERI